MGLKWNEVPFGGSAGHHLPGCNGQCDGGCSADMARAWAGLPPLGERQAPVASESPESARERIPTAADGVPVTMADLVGGCLR